jgi:pSer/pThr/pTyr-binding forkhead associated (FHA) protein
VIVCPKCGKENQDHYKFCLGCGNELPRDSAGGRGFRSPTPTANPIPDMGRGSSVPGGINPSPAQPQAFAPTMQAPLSQPGPFPPAQPQAFGPPPAAQPPAFVVQPPPSPSPHMVAAQPVAASGPASRPPSAPMPSTCPQCASPNPRNNRFCITCGFDMGTVAQQPPAPAADPQPDAPTPPMPPTVAAAQRVAVERARLVLIRPDGTEGGHHSLLEGESAVGRESGGVFSSDPFLSPRHASFTVGPGAVTVRDEGSLNGIYIRIERQQPVELHDGDVFRIGQEILRFEAFHPTPRQTDGTDRIGAEADGLVGKIVLVTGRESFASAFPVPVTGLYLGRERGDILFPEDGYVSGLHCQLAVNQGRLTVTDVGSSNGSYVRLHGPRAVRNGDFLLLGQQLFRVQTL